MNKNAYFIDNYELPQPLSKSEVSELSNRIKQGDETAKTKLVEHNIRLVIYEVRTKFKTIKYIESDLVSTGIIGLIKAIYTFDTTKNIEFITYAAACIDNEILNLLRQLKKYKNIDSLEKPYYIDDDGHELRLMDTLSYNNDLIDYYITEETYHEIRTLVNNLPEREKEVIKMRFGFYNNKIFNEQEIANKFNVSQSYISRLIKKIIKKLKLQLESNNQIKKVLTKH